MKTKHNIKIESISWLSTLSGGGYVSNFYEPENVDELVEICRDFYSKGLDFDIIGHTSNTLFTPDYVCDRMVSTRKLNKYEIQENVIVCQCGVSVRQLSIDAVENGIKGFEGLVDLPGTVASAIYGHATCYGCDLSHLLEKATILTSDGELQEVKAEYFDFKTRSSALKRKEKKAIILTLCLRRYNSNVEILQKKAEANHATRKKTQPEAKNSLGSIFKNEGKPTVLNRCIAAVTKIYGLFLRYGGNSQNQIIDKRKYLTFLLLGGLDVEPYVLQWNWYQWKDEKAYTLFWKYVRLHRRMFTKSDFEIEIKHNSNFKIP